jgi:hypothetical protein
MRPLALFEDRANRQIKHLVGVAVVPTDPLASLDRLLHAHESAISKARHALAFLARLDRRATAKPVPRFDHGNAREYESEATDRTTASSSSPNK